MTMQGGESLAERYSRLAQETPDRRLVDFEIRALDVLLSTLFLVITFPVAAMIGVGLLLTSGRPLFYRGHRVGRGGRVFTMTKFRALEEGAESRLGHHLGPALLEDICREAAADARVELRVLAQLPQAADHPVALLVPETRYLHGLLLQSLDA